MLIGLIFLYGCVQGDIGISEPLGKVTGEVVKDVNEPVSETSVGEGSQEEPQETPIEDDKISTVDEVKQFDVYVGDKQGFNPKELTISKGDKVIWRNEGHRAMILVVLKDGKQYLQQSNININSGDTFTYQFDEIGSYDIYWNIIHGSVTGKIVVQDKASGIIDESKEDAPKKGDALKPKYYTEEQLKEDLTRIFGSSRYNISNFTRDSSYPDYIRSSELKYHVIHTLKDRQIKTFKDFCGIYCGKNWDGWRYYINTSEFSLYAPLLGREDLSDEKKYEDYKRDMLLANLTQKERIYEVENGKVLEYKFWLLQQDNFGNFESNPLGYMVIYKMYCTPNMTVLIRPRWEDFSVKIRGKLTQLIVNWELEDDRVA